MVLPVSSSLKRLDLRSKGLIHHFSNLFAYITEISGGIIIKGGVSFQEFFSVLSQVDQMGPLLLVPPMPVCCSSSSVLFPAPLGKPWVMKKLWPVQHAFCLRHTQWLLWCSGSRIGRENLFHFHDGCHLSFVLPYHFLVKLESYLNAYRSFKGIIGYTVL